MSDAGNLDLQTLTCVAALCAKTIRTCVAVGVAARGPRMKKKLCSKTWTIIEDGTWFSSDDRDGGGGDAADGGGGSGGGGDDGDAPPPAKATRQPIATATDEGSETICLSCSCSNGDEPLLR